MKRWIICLSVLGLSGAAIEQSRAAAVWSVAGKEVLRLHATIGGKTPEKRVETLDARVTEILSKGNGMLDAREIKLKKEKGAVFITVQGQVLVTVAPDDATANHTTPEKLGRIWLGNVRNTLPAITPRVNRRGS